MFLAINWFTVLALLALWSLATWVLHAVAVWTLANAGALPGVASQATAAAYGLGLPEWLTAWVPPEAAQSVTAALSGLAPTVTGLLQAAPTFTSVLTTATWVIWGLGTAFLVLLGTAVHVGIRIWGRHARGSGPNPLRPSWLR